MAFENSFENIRIVRQIPIINGFVQLPDNLEQNRSAVNLAESTATIPDAVIGSMNAHTGGARLAGGKYGTQEWLEVCDEPVSCCSTPCDDAETLKDLQ